ncbi:NADP-dependent oxidoreductase [Actinomadura rayongensis]|uniref:Zinc-binding dehydrogenase n=1 Tax=Actinomadura rayongensis TaxID=1429076 RepID=A0A6I4WET4_9ACTN|nr:NADP-dependent oxidoreductase [Actinomadura rayongensis]MXQ67553.1 zinc-binding dehydrogenase [Actinomadura rayongensis]
MKAIQYTEYGGPEVLRLVETDTPTPAPGEILIAVKAAGVNGIDGKTRAGYLREFAPVTFPSGTGLDAAGTVVAVGDGVAGVAEGDEVFGSGRDTLAEYAVLTGWAVKPPSVSFAEASGYPLPAETAVRMLRLTEVKKGDTVLISGASGGVGSAAIQIAVSRGARVIGTASQANHDYLRSLGAIPIRYGPGLVARAQTAAGSPVDAALDVAGSGVLPELIELVGTPARVVTCADFSGRGLGVHTTLAAEDYTGACELVAGLAARGAFTIPVARSFALADAGAAQESNARGHIAGRTVVVLG